MTDSISYSVWNNFFLSAGIPNAVANEYAVKFSQHRIQINMLKEITKEILLDMGIKAMGDIIAILRHAKNLCTQEELQGRTKSGTGFSLTNIVMQSQREQAPPVSQIDRKPPITIAKSVSTAPALISNKIQSRLSLDSGALASNNSTTTVRDRLDFTTNRNPALSTTPGYVRTKTEPNKISLPEKTLTVRYPSASALAKVQQRMAEAAKASAREKSSVSIKSRLGTVPHDGSNSNNTESGYSVNQSQRSDPAQQETRSRFSDPRNGQKSRPSVSNSYLAVRRPNSDRNQGVKFRSHRLKSTVFNRLGEGPR